MAEISRQQELAAATRMHLEIKCMRAVSSLYFYIQGHEPWKWFLCGSLPFLTETVKVMNPP